MAMEGVVDGLDDIVREFLVESHDNLDQLDSDLVALEKEPGARELLASVFRTIHTIKGTSGFLAFGALERLTHAGENLLVELRDGKRAMDGPTADVLLRMVDTVRLILAAIEETGGEGDVAVDDVVAQINTVLADRPEAAPKRRIKKNAAPAGAAENTQTDDDAAAQDAAADETPEAQAAKPAAARRIVAKRPAAKKATAAAAAEASRADDVAATAESALAAIDADEAWAPVMDVQPLATHARAGNGAEASGATLVVEPEEGHMGHIDPSNPLWKAVTAWL